MATQDAPATPPVIRARRPTSPADAAPVATNAETSGSTVQEELAGSLTAEQVAHASTRQALAYEQAAHEQTRRALADKRRAHAETSEQLETKTAELEVAEDYVAELNEQLSQEQAKGKAADQPASVTIKHEGQEYQVKVPSFSLDGVRYTAADVTEGSTLLVRLVELGAGVIAPVQ